MKTASLLLITIVVFCLGFWFGNKYHAQKRYDLAWAAGNENGWASAVEFKDGLEKVQKPHDWDFKQRGATIYRFDQSTGEVCWIQSRPIDGAQFKQCPPFPPFEK